MKYQLINSQTGEQTLCDKVTIDGFDYYASKVEIRLNDLITNGYTVWLWKDDCSLLGIKKVIATNNPNIDVPQVVDEAEVIKLAFKHIASTGNSQFDRGIFHGFVAGYNKSQETHPFSEEDMIEFAVWLNDTDEIVKQTKHLDFAKSDKEVAKELLQLWKFQQPKKVYYEK